MLPEAGSAQSGGASGRPCPREVVTADRSERVQHLTAQEETGMEAALERDGIYLAERHAATGDFSLLVAFVAHPRQAVARECVHDACALLALQLGQRAIGRYVRLVDQHVSDARRDVLTQRGSELVIALRAQNVIPRRRIQLTPLYEDGRTRLTLQAGAHCNMGDVEHRRTAVTAMREEEAAMHLVAPLRVCRAQRDVERYAGEVGVWRALGDERGE